MTAHLTLEQLLALREPGAEPGDAAAREHLDACPACQAELDALHQRVARLRALPALRPARNAWPAVASRLRHERRGRRARLLGAAGLALAASLALAVTIRHDVAHPASLSATEQAIDTQKQHSAALEATIRQYDPDARPLDGRTARIAEELEDRIAGLDRELEAAELLQAHTDREARRLQLWRERVGLLDALVDVHVTRASNVGL
jgi:hypothetical protein